MVVTTRRQARAARANVQRADDVAVIDDEGDFDQVVNINIEAPQGIDVHGGRGGRSSGKRSAPKTSTSSRRRARKPRRVPWTRNRRAQHQVIRHRAALHSHGEHPNLITVARIKGIIKHWMESHKMPSGLHQIEKEAYNVIGMIATVLLARVINGASAFAAKDRRVTISHHDLIASLQNAIKGGR